MIKALHFKCIIILSILSWASSEPTTSTTDTYTPEAVENENNTKPETIRLEKKLQENDYFNSTETEINKNEENKPKNTIVAQRMQVEGAISQENEIGVINIQEPDQEQSNEAVVENKQKEIMKAGELTQKDKATTQPDIIETRKMQDPSPSEMLKWKLPHRIEIRVPVPCTCGVFLSGQFKKGSKDQPKGVPVLTQEMDIPFMNNAVGNRQCTNKCLELIIKHLPKSSEIICATVDRDQVFKERAYLFVKNHSDKWHGTNLSAGREFCCRDNIPYKCPLS